MGFTGDNAWGELRLADDPVGPLMFLYRFMLFFNRFYAVFVSFYTVFMLNMMDFQRPLVLRCYIL